ncbi:hypothetical protein IV57_GL001934 [Companilactobacillus kimchiensis]|uniref:Bacteriocin immunity protein n=2 Tax=Companilactobacillus kimchiensis TaxID=993692 RepID=A0A0R2L320_9LACO|nr:hypothetical protein IV57_GL001934 [Companilactobacillus kimchiensis]
MTDKKDELLQALKNLSVALNKYHGGSATAQYVSETLIELQKSEETAFIGTYLYFLPKAANLRRDEGIKLNETENTLWHKMASYKEVGYKLFPSIGL